MKYLFTEKCINFRLSLSLLLLVREKKKLLSRMQMTKHGNNATNVVNIHKHKRGSFVGCSIFVIKPYLLTVGLIVVRIAWFSCNKHLTFNFPEHLRLAFSSKWKAREHGMEMKKEEKKITRCSSHWIFTRFRGCWYTVHVYIVFYVCLCAYVWTKWAQAMAIPKPYGGNCYAKKKYSQSELRTKNIQENTKNMHVTKNPLNRVEKG